MNQYNFNIVALLTTFFVAWSLGDDCTVTSYNNVQTALSKCTTIIIDGITVPAGKTLQLDLKDGTSLTFKGTIRFDHEKWNGPLVVVTGNSVRVNGNGATLDGQGAQYWDGLGDKTIKPKFFRIETTGGSRFSYIKLLNCPVQCVSISGASNTVLDHFTIDVSAGDAGGKGHNTDGFDVSSSRGITVQNSVVMNQDDCVAVNQGNHYIFHNLTCSGGHGLSLSVGLSKSNGDANTVYNVTFSDSKVINSRNGIHVKTHSDGGTGSITHVTYKNINLTGITYYGVNVQEDYADGSSTGKPKGNIPIKQLYLETVTGSMSGGSDGMPVYILCGTGGCDNWNWTHVSITNGKQADSCNFTPSGFKCT